MLLEPYFRCGFSLSHFSLYVICATLGLPGSSLSGRFEKLRDECGENSCFDFLLLRERKEGRREERKEIKKAFH